MMFVRVEVALRLLDEMKRSKTRKMIQVVSVFGGIASLILLIYAVQPWGNYAFENIFDFIYLFIISVWVISPYILFIVVTSRADLNRIKDLVRMGAAIAVFGVGIGTITSTLFIYPDPQGGLIFFVVPAYQWLIILATESFNSFVKKN